MTQVYCTEYSVLDLNSMFLERKINKKLKKTTTMLIRISALNSYYRVVQSKKRAGNKQKQLHKIGSLSNQKSNNRISLKLPSSNK